MTPETQMKIVNYIKLSAPFVEAHLKSAAVKQAQEEKIAQLIPAAVEALVKNQRIGAHDQEKAAQVLRDPARALEVLINVANHRTAEEEGRLGQADSTKQASADNDPFYGGSRSANDRPSDRAWYQALGVI